MLKRMAVVAFFLGVLLVPAGLAQEGDFSAAVDDQKGGITLATQGVEYDVYVSKGSISLKVASWPDSLRFSLAEVGARGMDWMGVSFVSADVIKDTDEEKEVKAVYSVAFKSGEPGPKTTRGKALAEGKEPPEMKAQIELTVRVKKEMPCVFFQYKVVNPGEPFRCYCLPWINSGADYVIPGADGPEEKAFKEKYHTVAEGKVPWLLLRKDADNGLGMIFPEPAKIFIGAYGTPKSLGTIYLNALPRKQDIPTGGNMTMKMVFMPAKSADEVAAVQKKIAQD